MHKLLFAFQICAKILLGAKKMNQAEHDFFLRGGQVFNKDEQPANPCADWISEAAWDNLTVSRPDPNPNPHPIPNPSPNPIRIPNRNQVEARTLRASLHGSEVEARHALQAQG